MGCCFSSPSARYGYSHHTIPYPETYKYHAKDPLSYHAKTQQSLYQSQWQEPQSQQHPAQSLGQKTDISMEKDVDADADELEDQSHLAAPPSNWTKGELLGQGAFGRVYQGLNNDTGELIAVKQLLINHDEGNQGRVAEHIKNLEDEVGLLRTLQHDNIVRYLGTQNEKDCLNIFLEYVPGGSIAHMLQRFGPLNETVIRVYTRQILQGLEYLHSKNIVHRDIKGANILVNPQGVVKLADFGASKQIESLATIGSGLKSIKGTPFWMAPEVIKQTGHGRPADIWSVGCTVIEMATGKPPWSNYAPVAAMFQIASSKDPPPLPENISPEGRDFLLQCFNRVMKQRADATTLLQHPFVTKTIPQPNGSASISSSHVSSSHHRHSSSPNFERRKSLSPPSSSPRIAAPPAVPAYPRHGRAPSSESEPATPPPHFHVPHGALNATMPSPASHFQPPPVTNPNTLSQGASLEQWCKTTSGLDSLSLNPLTANMTLTYNPIQEPTWNIQAQPLPPPPFRRSPGKFTPTSTPATSRTASLEDLQEHVHPPPYAAPHSSQESSHTGSPRSPRSSGGQSGISSMSDSYGQTRGSPIRNPSGRQNTTLPGQTDDLAAPIRSHAVMV